MTPLSPSSLPGLDQAYRPATYWPDEGLRHAILGNILGEVRHRLIQEALESHSGDFPPAEMLRPELEPEVRDSLWNIDPMCVGGEYLPSYRRGEVEIARVALQSATGDVTAVRARLGKDGLIRYRIVDEYVGEYQVHPKWSRLPLTMGEMIHLLDTAKPDGTGLVLDVLKRKVACGSNLKHLQGFITVRSDFYPQLEAHYEELCESYLHGLEEEEDDDEA